MNSTNANPPTIQEVLSGNTDIASPPEIFLKVSEILDDPTKNAYDAGRIIESDPGLTSRLLKIVNSAIFGFPSKVTSVARAIAIIGNVELRNLVLATVIVDRFSDLPSEIPSMREFWSTSVRCALYAKALASHCPQCDEASTVFVCGLLHNLGSLILYARLPDLANEAAVRAKKDAIPQSDAERKIIGFDRYDIGAELCKRWRLPELIIDTIKFHNRPTEANDHAAEIAVVCLADHLSNSFVPDQEEKDYTTILEHPGATLIKVTADIIESITDTVESDYGELFALIYHA